MTLLDPRSTPTTTEERELAYQATDPTADEIFGMASYQGECVVCEQIIHLMDPIWIREMEDGIVRDLAEMDPDYDPCEPVYAFACYGCAREHFKEEMRNYDAERSQCAREGLLEEACNADDAGMLDPVQWLEIMKANLGYVEPAGHREAIDGMVLEYQERFPRSSAAYLETVRAKLYQLTPMPTVSLVITSPTRIEHMPEGLARFSFEAKLVTQ